MEKSKNKLSQFISLLRILYTLLRKLGILKDMSSNNRENPYKVQAKLNELNRNTDFMVSPGLGLNHFPSIPSVERGPAAFDLLLERNEWVPVPGFFALTGFSNEDKPVFNPAFGVTVKVFMNRKTGELKIFSSKEFE